MAGLLAPPSSSSLSPSRATALRRAEHWNGRREVAAVAEELHLDGDKLACVCTDVVPRVRLHTALLGQCEGHGLLDVVRKDQGARGRGDVRTSGPGKRDVMRNRVARARVGRLGTCRKREQCAGGNRENCCSNG